jgi:thiamine biosynthesis lipoprotein
MANNKGLKWQLPFLAFLIIGTVLILRKQAPFQTDEGLVFGTMYKITYQSKENLKKDIEAELQKVNNSLSPFSKESVITRINNNEEMTADSMFTYVFRLAKDISQETYGAFDITVAPLVNAWGFGFKNKHTGTYHRQHTSVCRIRENRPYRWKNRQERSTRNARL